MKNNSIIQLTPTHRLARQRQSAQDIIASEEGHSVWPTPTILPLSTFTALCWQNGIDKGLPFPLLINDDLALAWWVERLQQDYPYQPAMPTAKLACDAYDLCQAWALPVTTFLSGNEENRIFAEWAKAFTAFLEKENFILASQLPALFQIYSQDLPWPDEIHLIGFTDIAPTILTWLENLPCKLIHIRNESKNSDTLLLPCESISDEIETMARWAKTHLNQGNTPIACVVPQLAALRSEITTTFNEIVGETNYNISSGLPLSAYPIVAAALQSLTWTSTLPFDALTLWLRSPYLGNAKQEQQERLELDLILREQSHQHWSREDIIQAGDDLAPDLISRLQQESTLLDINAMLAPGQHAQRFLQRLQCLGWPGERGLSSEAFQCYNRFIALLDEFAALDHILPICDLKTALRQLQLKIDQTVFQKQTLNESIQILGTLEAAGNTYSRLWIMGCHDKQFPAPPSPNPFIPFALQKKIRLPRATAEREYEFAADLIKHFSQSADEVIFSYPLIDDHLPLSPSRLIATYPVIHKQNLNLLDQIRISEQLNASRQLTLFHDDNAPPCENPKAFTHGIYILQSQATCPFQAFAYYRLNASSVVEPEGGISGSQRGQLIHDSLEYFWRQTKTQAQLLAYHETEFETCLKKSIHRAIKKRFQETTHLNTQLKLEKKRLFRLLSAWLIKEKERAPFTVSAIEKKVEWNLCGLPIHIRLDRIDEIANGQHIIIDYKSGQTHYRSWFDETLTEPQLPLYAITQPDVSALLLAEIRSQSLKFKGVTVDPNFTIPGVQPFTDISEFATWSEQLNDWQHKIEMTATAFLSGKAAVAPQDESACDYCDLQPLCRIYDEGYRFK